ncbi:MAG: hypothetical protein Q4D02_00850 [Clostridia bacterium]|nr:hypothetical protein [Clostridia bacterium]
MIEFLSSKKEAFIVITKDTLQGNIDKKLYIKQLRLASEKSKIVYIVDKLTQEYKEFLFANEVFNIIEGNTIDFEILTHYIDNPQSIVYRNIDHIDINDKKRRVIGICGTSSVGKSLTSTLLAKDLVKNIGENVVLLDMNMENPSIDILNNLDSNNKAFHQYIQNDNSGISNFLIKKLGVTYVINKPCKNLKFSKKKIDCLYKFLLKNYQYLIIDLSSDLFDEYTKFWLERVTDIFFIVKPNYLSVRRSLNYLEKLGNKNLSIIVNEIKMGSLEISQMKSLLSEYKIVGKIYYGKNIESYINGAISEFALDYEFEEISKMFHIKSKLNTYLEKYKRLKESLERI